MGLREDVMAVLVSRYGNEDDARRVYHVRGSADSAVAAAAKRIAELEKAPEVIASYLVRRNRFRDGWKTWNAACLEKRQRGGMGIFPPGTGWWTVRTAVFAAEALLGPLPRDLQVMIKSDVRAELRAGDSMKGKRHE